LGFRVHEVVDERNGMVQRETYNLDATISGGGNAVYINTTRGTMTGSLSWYAHPLVGLPTEILTYRADGNLYHASRQKVTSYETRFTYDNRTYFGIPRVTESKSFEGYSFSFDPSDPDATFDCGRPVCAGVLSSSTTEMNTDDLGNVL